MKRSLVTAMVACLFVSILALAGCGGPTVPDVVGMRQADAVRTLQDAGYLLGDVAAVATDEVPLGMIAAQSPAAGEEAKEGEKVSLSIALSNGERALVPALTGLELVTAEGVADALGFEKVLVEQYSEEAPKGSVAAQSPEQGAEVDSGSTLLIVVSKGAAPDKAKVPDVSGKTEAEAKGALEALGFVVDTFKVYDSTVAGGKVIAQSPDAGKEAVAGSTVRVVVSLGKGTGAVKVPTVTGKKEADAKKALEAAGLKMRSVSQYDEKVAKGLVAVQFPSSGSTAARGAEVLVVVSLGAEPASTVAVPGVIGMTAAQAIKALEAAGLAVTVEEVPVPGGTGVAVYQFPAENAQVAPGSGVVVFIGLAGQPSASGEATTP